MSARTALTILWISLSAVALTICFGCGSSGLTPPATVVHQDDFDPYNPENDPAAEYLIRRGDGVNVKFLYNPELNIGSITVRDDGSISLPIIGDLAIAGKTTHEATDDIRQAYDDYVSTSGHGKKLKAGDELQIRFIYNPQLNQRVVIRPDGKVSLLKLGVIKAEGMGFSEFENYVLEQYKRYIIDPEMSFYLLNSTTKKIFTEPGDITVMVTNPQPKEVFVGGLVSKPGLIMFKDWMTPIQAISTAGGLMPGGDGSRVVYITRGNKGDAITTKLNLDAYLQGGKKANLYLRHGDVLYVPRSGIAKLNEVVRQYIRDSLPVSTNFGFNYLLNRQEEQSNNQETIRVTGSDQQQQ